MISAKYEWTRASQQPDEGFLKLAKKEGLDKLVATILFNRGVQTGEELVAFLQADLSQLHDPYLLNDMDKAVQRIRSAISQNEQILVYGDYDADGMTAASIVKETLEMLGAEVVTYLPNRFTDGYGPNLSVYKYFIEQQGVSLIVTVDNGVAGHEAIAYAQEQGVDVVVTDHHSLPSDLPEAYAIVHPEHPEADYPFKHLAGCGVAFKLAQALLEGVPTEFLDLVAIGSIADMVSLTGENRILVKAGLQVLRETERLGLQELLSLADIDPATVTEETVGFTIAPQLNALGRLDDPNPALDLLTDFDEEEAASIAQMVAAKNEERKELVARIYDEASQLVKPDLPVQVLAKEGWHPGVLGIVAGRLLEQLGQPVIVLGITDGLAKGSARSPEALDLFSALSPHPELFVAFGGHSGAAGMTLEVDKLSELQQVLVSYVAEQAIDLNQKPMLQVDEQLELTDLSLETIKSLDKLAPFGMDHKKPVFGLKQAHVKQARTMGQGGGHLKLRLAQGETQVDLVAFGQGALAQEFQQAKGLELAVTLSVNRWNGATSLQLMLEDARVEGVQLFDIRAKNAPFPAGVPILSADTTSKQVVVADLPDSLADLKDLFVGKQFEAVYFKNTIKTPYYLAGYGSRDQYAKLYKTIYQFPEFDVRYKLKDLSQFLKIDQILLVKMIQIFEELGFVTITDGVMTVNKEADKRPIADSQIYQDLVETVKYQELMALGTPEEMYARMYQQEGEG